MDRRAPKRAISSVGLAVPPTGLRPSKDTGEQTHSLEEFELVTTFEQSLF